MKIYCAKLIDNDYESFGFKYSSSKKEAEKAIEDFEFKNEIDPGCSNSEIETIVTGNNKADIIDLLNEYASHNDNG